MQFDQGSEALPALDAAEAELSDPVGRVPSAWVERKRFAIAVHYRATPTNSIPELEDAVAAVAARHPTLRMTGGKRIFELRPAIDWDKGTALHWLIQAAELDPENTLPVFVGDDVTDEDAFVAVRDRGFGVIVGEDDRITAANDRLDDSTAVRDLLRRLVEHLERR